MEAGGSNRMVTMVNQSDSSSKCTFTTALQVFEAEESKSKEELLALIMEKN